MNKTGEGSRKTKKARQEFEQLKTNRTEQIARESAKRVLDKMKLNKDIGHIPGPIYSTLSSKNLQTGLAASTITNKSYIHIDNEKDRVSINAPLEVNGRNIMKELDEMRDALLLLKRDVDMEAKYPRLKELKDQYEQALEKYRTFERLK